LTARKDEQHSQVAELVDANCWLEWRLTPQ